MRKKTIFALPALAYALLIGGEAQAHPRLMTTYPSANSGVRATNRVTLSFSERLMGPMSGADVLMTGHPGKPHHAPLKMAGFKTSVSGDGKTLQLVSQRALPAGSYRVQWHVVAADTHRATGAFAFMVK